MLYFSFMNGKELKRWRERLELKQAGFGVYLAQLMNKERAYVASEISNWENGVRPVPGSVSSALYRKRLEELGEF